MISFFCLIVDCGACVPMDLPAEDFHFRYCIVDYSIFINDPFLFAGQVRDACPDRIHWHVPPNLIFHPDHRFPAFITIPARFGIKLPFLEPALVQCPTHLGLNGSRLIVIVTNSLPLPSHCWQSSNLVSKSWPDIWSTR